MARTNDNNASRDVLQRVDFLDIDDPIDRLLVIRNLGFRMGSIIVAMPKETTTGVAVEIERVL